MPNFIRDNTALPGTKTDNTAGVGGQLTAAEYNTIRQAMLDIQTVARLGGWSPTLTSSVTFRGVTYNYIAANGDVDWAQIVAFFTAVGGFAASTDTVQTLLNKTVTNIKDDTRAYARAKTSAGQSIPNATATPVNFGTIDFDSRSAITVATGTTPGVDTWRYTVPAGHGGIYLVSSAVGFLTSASKTALLFIFKNNASYSRLSWLPPTTGNTNPSGSDLISLVPGDYIDIRIYQDSGGAVALQPDNQQCWVSIIRQVTNL